MRLVTWASDRLKAEDKQYAVLAACAAGGQVGGERSERARERARARARAREKEATAFYERDLRVSEREEYAVLGACVWWAGGAAAADCKSICLVCP